MPPDERNPSEFYDRRAREIDLAADAANRRCGSWQAASVLLAVLVLAVAYGIIFSKKLPAWTVALPIAGIVFVARETQKHRCEVLKLLSVRDYYDKGAARLRRDWDALDDGKDFIDRDHIYAADLDLFGRASLFQCSAPRERTRAAKCSHRG